MTSIQLPTAPFPVLHRGAQRAGVALTLVLLVALVRWPDATMHVLWNMVIPLLPAVFLVNPLLWRNVCPLATINAVAGRHTVAPRLAMPSPGIPTAVGIVLLAVMVPARRFLFNVDGPILAATIVAVAGLAALAGRLLPRRAGFCNAICPVLPVEKLYGQAPLVAVGTARCGTCTGCTPSGCIELAGDKTVAQTLGRARRDVRWLRTAFGAFAAAFPGFIVGYFTTTNGTLADAGAVYLHVATWALGSYLVVAAIAVLARVSVRLAMPVLGGLSLGLYYWFASPALATAWGLPESAGAAVRALAFTLVGVWAWRQRERAA